jgi:hypothetical protein
MVWYAYGKFTENSCKEKFIKGNQQERDDLVVDYNLSEEIRNLEIMQRQLLKKISNDVGI